MNDLKTNPVRAAVCSPDSSNDSASLLNPERMGQLVLDLLDKQTGNTWKYDLWSIMEGNIAHQAATDIRCRLLEEFMTFRDLIFFFEEIDALREGKKIERP